MDPNHTPCNPSPENHTPDQCGARTRSGEPCRSKPIVGARRCRLHGGRCTITNAGPANKNWKGGRYSKQWLAPALRDSLTEALDEGSNALDLTPELALITARLTERLRDLSDSEIPDWDSVNECVIALRLAIRNSDQSGIVAAITQIERTAKAGAGVDSAWREIRALIRDRTKVVAQETTRRQKLADFVAGDKHRAALRLISGVVMEQLNSIPALTAALVEKTGQFDPELLRRALCTRIGTQLADLVPLLQTTARGGDERRERGI